VGRRAARHGRGGIENTNNHSIDVVALWIASSGVKFTKRAPAHLYEHSPFTLKVSHAPIWDRLLVFNDPLV